VRNGYAACLMPKYTIVLPGFLSLEALCVRGFQGGPCADVLAFPVAAKVEKSRSVASPSRPFETLWGTSPWPAPPSRRTAEENDVPGMRRIKAVLEGGGRFGGYLFLKRTAGEVIVEDASSCEIAPALSCTQGRVANEHSCLPPHA
jgi:hypothetical protein